MDGINMGHGFILRGNITCARDAHALYKDGLISQHELFRQLKLLSYRPFLTINVFRA